MKGNVREMRGREGPREGEGGENEERGEKEGGGRKGVRKLRHSFWAMVAPGLPPPFPFHTLCGALSCTITASRPAKHVIRLLKYRHHKSTQCR